MIGRFVMSCPSQKGSTEAVRAPGGKGALGTKAAEERAEYGFSRGEIAAYLMQLTSELAVLARCQRLDSVAYFLEMARIEASIIESDELDDKE